MSHRARRRNRAGTAIRLLSAAGCAGALLAGAPEAAAGTYDVYACDAAAGRNNSWSASAGTGMLARAACPTRGDEHRGLVVRSLPGPGTVAASRRALMTFRAPIGAELAGLTYKWHGRRADGGWSIGLADGGGNLISGCRAGEPSFTSPCQLGDPDPRAPAAFRSLGGRSAIRIEASCRRPGGCAVPSGGAAARVSLYHAVVRVRDATRPRVSRFSGGLWTDDWSRGTRAASFNASDNVGVRETRFYVDGERHGRERRSCDFTFPVPCKGVSSASYRLNTEGLSDGRHRFQVEVVDAAGNLARLGRAVHVDNHAPGRVAGVGVTGGDGWRPFNWFDVGWSNPSGQHAPIVRAHYKLCRSEPTPLCASGSREGAGIQTLRGLSVPAPGDYLLRVWLEDAAGNAEPGHASDPVHLRFDDTPPPKAQPRALDRWLGAREAQGHEHPLDLAAGALPPSGVKGFSVTLDGSVPDTSVDTTRPAYATPELREGTTIIRARAVSGSGVPSREAGAAAIRVDRTPPAARASAPDPETWQRRPATVAISGDDQPGLSGMSPPPGRAVEEGAHIAYRVDGGELRRASGAAAHVTVGGDGRHSVAYRAVDNAGNESALQLVQFKIDATAPAAAFEPQDPRDPQKVAVVTSDTASGVAGGTIQLRKTGTTTWRSLETALRGRRLVARVDDARLPPGAYALRVRVRDEAGNGRVTDRRRDGGQTRLWMPLRLGTQLSARASGEGGRRVVVPFGTATAMTGRLETVEGRPIERATLNVLRRVDTPDSRFTRIDTATTDLAGRFSYTAPPGPSRTIRFTYDGSRTTAPSRAGLDLAVPAVTTFSVDKNRIGNGDAVRFSGRLPGRPLPPKGKIVELQSFFRDEWRTVAITRSRAESRGAWTYEYRFGATTGLVRYRFRVRLPAEDFYPYEIGHSRVVEVIVDGRS